MWKKKRLCGEHAIDIWQHMFLLTILFSLVNLKIKMLPKIILFLFLFLSFPVFSASVDWSGQARFESYSQFQYTGGNYGLYYLALDPTVHVLDGLSLTLRAELREERQKGFTKKTPHYYRQSGSIFFHKNEDTGLRTPDVRVSQVYLDFQSETFKIRIGRAPYHFGMGTTYLATSSPFLHWISSHYQLSFYADIYGIGFQPAVFVDNNYGVLLSEFSFKQETWQVEALLQYDFSSFINDTVKDEDKRNLAELYGKYEKENLNVEGSLTYLIKEETSFLASLEGKFRLPFKSFSLFAELGLGGTYGEASFHPDFNQALLFANKQILEDKDQTLQASEGVISKTYYLVPRLDFAFLEESFHIRPQVLFATEDGKSFTYELDMEALYAWNETLFFTLQGGVLFQKDLDPEAGVLAQAAVSF